MNYNLTQHFRDKNIELLLNGVITKERYFIVEKELDHINNLLIINLN